MSQRWFQAGFGGFARDGGFGQKKGQKWWFWSEMVVLVRNVDSLGDYATLGADKSVLSVGVQNWWF